MSIDVMTQGCLFSEALALGAVHCLSIDVMTQGCLFSLALALLAVHCVIRVTYKQL